MSLFYKAANLQYEAQVRPLSMNLVMPVSGLSRDAIELCRNWMAPLAETAGLFGVPKRREFSRVDAEDEHNIQTHTDYLTMLVSIFFLSACLSFKTSNKCFPFLGRRKNAFAKITSYFWSAILLVNSWISVKLDLFFFLCRSVPVNQRFSTTFQLLPAALRSKTHRVLEVWSFDQTLENGGKKYLTWRLKLNRSCQSEILPYIFFQAI